MAGDLTLQLLLLFMVNVCCILAAITTTTAASESITINNGYQHNDISAYINLMLCPLELQPWNCANREGRHILDNWNNELHIQWNKLKEEADHQISAISDRRGYEINKYHIKEKPSTILKKIEIGVNYMKAYLAETLDGFMGRQVQSYNSIMQQHKFNNHNEGRNLNKSEMDQRAKKILQSIRENFVNRNDNPEMLSIFTPINKGLDTTKTINDSMNENVLSSNDKSINEETIQGIESSKRNLSATGNIHHEQRGLYKQYNDNESDAIVETQWSEDSGETEDEWSNDKTGDMVKDGFNSKHTKIMKYGRSSGEERGKKKKKKKAIAKLMLLAAFLKGKIELLLKIFSAGLQVKFFGIALIGLLINIARFWIDLKRTPHKVVFVEHAHHQHHYDDHGDDWEAGGGGGGYWKRSLKTDSSINNSQHEAEQKTNYQKTHLYDSSQDMAYWNQPM